MKSAQNTDCHQLFVENILASSEHGLLLAVHGGDCLRIAEFNDIYAPLIGLGDHPLHDKPLSVLIDLMRPIVDANENFPDWEKRLCEIPEEPTVVELLVLTPAPRVLRFLVSSALDSSARPIGVLHRVRDITYDKNLEQQAIHSQKMEGVGTLAGGIAHDFNNILTAILGYSSALKVDLESNKAALKKLDQIIRSAHRAAELTRNLLAFSRKSPHIPQVVDFNAVVRDTANMLAFALPESIKLKVNLAPNLPCVIADPSQLTQIITNLFLNARDAIFDSGTIKLTTRLGEDSLADNSSSPPQLYVVLDVEDDGVGIQKENLTRIFEPFYTTKETGKGTGLGLAMVYGAVKQHYGFVEVESAPNLGSRFSIYLPATDQKLESNEPSEPSPVTTDALGNATILVIDDEEDLRALCEMALSDRCRSVLTASDGIEGVEIFKKSAAEVDLIILDLTMPRMDGVECFARLREIRPDVPIMISSGYAKDMGASDLMLQGAIGFLEKPFTIAKLTKEVEDALHSLAANPSS